MKNQDRSGIAGKTTEMETKRKKKQAIKAFTAELILSETIDYCLKLLQYKIFVIELLP